MHWRLRYFEAKKMPRFSFDSHGYPRAVGEEAEHVLCGFLEQDIQGSVDGCTDYLNILARVKISALREWSGTGNAHTVSITPNGVSITNEWAISACAATYSLDEFENPLRGWAKLISNRPA
jgi:hypothetical protein